LPSPNSCHFGALCGVYRCISHRNASSLVSFDRYGLHLFSCKIWG
jgi:hypothetical protein